jgi:hypothetical protein
MNSSPPYRASWSTVRSSAVQAEAAGLEQPVADPMPEALVELLEVVQVHHGHGERHLAAAGAFDRRGTFVRPGPTVRQAGQGVLAGKR